MLSVPDGFRRSPQPAAPPNAKQIVAISATPNSSHPPRTLTPCPAPTHRRPLSNSSPQLSAGPHPAAKLDPEAVALLVRWRWVFMRAGMVELTGTGRAHLGEVKGGVLDGWTQISTMTGQ